MRKPLVAISVFVLLLSSLLIYLSNQPPTIILTINGHEVFCEIADTEALRAKGLMYRDSMKENAGMVFRYLDEDMRSFHMANCKFPIAIAFADSEGKIVSITEMSLEPNKTYSSQKPAMFAVELNKGWYDKHGVKVGDKIEGLYQQYKQ